MAGVSLQLQSKCANVLVLVHCACTNANVHVQMCKYKFANVNVQVQMCMFKRACANVHVQVEMCMDHSAHAYTLRDLPINGYYVRSVPRLKAARCCV